MELTHVEQMALFEGLMDAEYRKLKPLFPRCRLKKALFTGGIYFHIQNGRRHCEVEVGTGVHINCWRNERYGRDDDLYHSLQLQSSPGRTGHGACPVSARSSFPLTGTAGQNLDRAVS